MIYLGNKMVLIQHLTYINIVMRITKCWQNNHIKLITGPDMIILYQDPFLCHVRVLERE